jgi:plastocyanin
MSRSAIGRSPSACAVLASWLVMSCAAPPSPAHSVYRPRTRATTITTVPLLVKEQTRTFPFLARDFGHGGVLDGKEVYGYSPSTLVAYTGDTLHVTVVNPEDDVHDFEIDDPVEQTAVSLPAQATTRFTILARAPGIYVFRCTIATHQPFMTGVLVVLAPPEAASS